MSENPQSTTVLVTGASGFAAMHTILDLLAQGYCVRGSLRSLERADALRATLARHSSATDRLEFVQADLMQEAGWSDAVRGCSYVLHIASPFPLFQPKNEDELIAPAREGTLRVLRAAQSAGVKRVVLTSSTVAISSGYPERQQPFDESDWSRLEGQDAYAKSKTLAEQAAWEFIRGPLNPAGMEMAVINPGYIIGPLLDKNFRTSSEAIRKILNREVPGIPRIMVSVVDVRDVAAAHRLAMTVPAAAGQRFCCVGQTMWMVELARVLSKHFAPLGYRVPTNQLPNALIRCVALFDKTVRLILPDLGKRITFSSARARTVLDWKPRPAEESIIAMGSSLIEQGFITKK